MAETTFAIDSLTWLAAAMVDQHKGDVMLETAIAKLFCSEGLWQVLDDAVQIFGGEGYMREVGLERTLRDARINRIVEGTTEVMTAFIALVGMKGVGEEFEQVLRASKHPIGNFGRLAKFARDQWRDVVVGTSDVDGLHHELESEGESLSRLTTMLARRVGSVLRKYKQDIIDMQLVQERITWAAADLFAMAAVISRLQSMLEHAGESDGALGRDLIVGKGFCRRAAERIVQRLRGLSHNQDDEIISSADAILGYSA